MFGRTHHRVRGLKLLSKSITLKQAFWPAFVLPRNRSNGNAASVLPPVYGIVTERPAVPDADTMINFKDGLGRTGLRASSCPCGLRDQQGFSLPGAPAFSLGQVHL